MWTFAVLLPLMIGDLVDESNPYWESYLLLLQITKYCAAQIVTPAIADILKVLIDEHHKLFNTLYPASMSPKFHYMVHFPRQLLE